MLFMTKSVVIDLTQVAAVVCLRNAQFPNLPDICRVTLKSGTNIDIDIMFSKGLFDAMAGANAGPDSKIWRLA